MLIKLTETMYVDPSQITRVTYGPEYVNDGGLIKKEVRLKVYIGTEGLYGDGTLSDFVERVNLSVQPNAIVKAAAKPSDGAKRNEP